MKLQTKITALFLAISVFPLILISYFGYSFSRKSLLDKTMSQMESIADLQEARVEEVVSRYIEHTRLIASRTRLSELVHEYRLEPSEEIIQQLQIILDDAERSVGVIRDISVLSLNGEVIVSTASLDHLQPFLEEGFFEQAKTGAFLDDMYLDENRVLFVQIGAPIQNNRVTDAVVIVHAYADPIISITEDYSGLGETGEVLIARANAHGDAIFLTPLRFNAGAALSLAVPKEYSRLPVISAISGSEIQITSSETIDYRGEPVLSVTRYVDTVGWGIVAKIDRSEAFAPIAVLVRAVFAVLFISVLILLFVALVVSRGITLPISRLTKAAQDFSRGKFGGFVEIETDDEIGVLSQAFNSTSRQLKEMYGSLEQKVEKRTERIHEQMREAMEQQREMERVKSATLNILDDLSEEKKKIELAKAKDDAILNNIGDGLVFLDKDRKFVLLNRVAQELLGLDEQTVLGKSWYDFVRISDVEGKTIPKKELVIEQVLVSDDQNAVRGMGLGRLNFISGPDGTRFPIAATAAKVSVENNVLGVIIVFRDITKESEVDRAKTEFVSLASHQLRTPLSSINWYTEMLLGGDAGRLTKKQREFLSEIDKSSDRMVELVNALLNVSRLELGTFTVQPELTNTVELAKEVLKELQPMIEKKGHTIKTFFDSQIPVLNVDPKLMRIILQNLLTNAIKYTPDDGKISFEMNKDVGSVQIKVSDNGMGIPPEQKEKIFTKLFRADNVRELDTEGTGLGLYIVKSILDEVHGSIAFDSKIGEGTTFFVTIPLSGMKKRDGTRELS